MIAKKILFTSVLDSAPVRTCSAVSRSETTFSKRQKFRFRTKSREKGINRGVGSGGVSVAQFS